MDKTQAQQFWGTGRRKTAVARVRLAYGAGKRIVNGKPIEQYFPGESLRSDALRPLRTLELEDKLDVWINVDGGGLSGQSGAVRHGVARALLKLDPTYRPSLKQEGFLTRDARMKERKKYGQPGARKKYQYSKR